MFNKTELLLVELGRNDRWTSSCRSAPGFTFGGPLLRKKKKEEEIMPNEIERIKIKMGHNNHWPADYGIKGIPPGTVINPDKKLVKIKKQKRKRR